MKIAWFFSMKDKSKNAPTMKSKYIRFLPWHPHSFLTTDTSNEQELAMKPLLGNSSAFHLKTPTGGTHLIKNTRVCCSSGYKDC